LTIYPRVVPKLGGGAPVSVTFQFVGKSPIDNAERMRAFLIDETDNGFYLVRTVQDKEAIFLPRSQVAAVYFKQAEETEEPANK
jgi:hypothetical protein